MEQGRWETDSRILLAPFVRSLLQITDPRFFFIDENYWVRNLQEGPKTRLIRGIYIIYQKKKFGSDINNLVAKEEMTTGERYCLILLIY